MWFILLDNGYGTEDTMNTHKLFQSHVIHYDAISHRVYPPPNADHKGSALRFLSKIYFVRHYDAVGFRLYPYSNLFKFLFAVKDDVLA